MSFTDVTVITVSRQLLLLTSKGLMSAVEAKQQRINNLNEPRKLPYETRM